jgi:hypothetical protein
MNKKHLLVAASALVVGLSFYGSNAYAQNWDDKDNNAFLLANTAVAASVQAGFVGWNHADGTDGSNNTGNISGIGLTNVQQNNGANSQLQDANTLGIVLSNCACTTSAADLTANTALAVSAQVGAVIGNRSEGASNTTLTDHDKGGGLHFDDAGGGWHDDYFNKTSNAVQSSNSIGGVGGTGLMNISQNNGNNSLLQSSNTVAAIIHN